MPTQRSHTLPSRTSRHKNSWTEIAKTYIDTGLPMTEDRRPAYNSSFAKKRIQWLIEHSTSQQLLCYVDSFELRNPILRKAAKPLVVMTMINKFTHIFLLILLLSSCKESGKNISEENKVIQTEQKINVEDSIPERVKGINLFIEFMKEEDFVMDTIRLSKVWVWKAAAKCDKEMINGAIQIKFPFPVEDYRKYLSDPITYFWVKKNPQDSTNNDGLDFLLLTYKIDSTGMNMEREIYKSLSSHYMNFPTYCIRNENRIYILTNRMSVQEEVTEKFAKKLRDLIEPKSVIFGHYGMDTIR